MSIPLSEKTKRVAEILLRAEHRSRIEKRLEEETAENIPMWHDFTPEGLDRIRFSVIKLIAQNSENENVAFNHAMMDWRDLFISAGFAQSATEHELWYAKLTGKAG